MSVAGKGWHCDRWWRVFQQWRSLFLQSITVVGGSPSFLTAVTAPVISGSFTDFLSLICLGLENSSCIGNIAKWTCVSYWLCDQGTKSSQEQDGWKCWKNTVSIPEPGPWSWNRIRDVTGARDWDSTRDPSGKAKVHGAVWASELTGANQDLEKEHSWESWGQGCVLRPGVCPQVHIELFS